MDPRETILARLLAIAQAIPGVIDAARNNNDFSDLARPAIVILDGNEEASEADPETRPTNAPRRVTMTPEIVVLASGPASSIGTTINGFRAALIAAILLDPTLLGLVQDGRSRQSIRYISGDPTFASGRAIEAELRMNFSLVYVLRPDQLIG